MTAILELDECQTWPPELRRTLEDALPLLRMHRAEESADAQRESLKRRANPFDGDYGALLARVDRTITGCSFTVYHCARLLEEEIPAVRRDGLRVCDANLVRRKFEILLSRDLISAECFEDAPRLDLSNRKGIIHVLLHAESVRDSGTNNFFSFWGGEAVCDSRLIDRDKLRELGVPCVVEAIVP